MIKIEMKKTLFIGLGILCNTIGLIGIVVPGLPTTPFLLLAAGLYVRSSDKLYHQLLQSRLFGPYITDFQKHKGIRRKVKVRAITLMWTMITLSITLTKPLWVKFLLPGLGIIGTVVMAFLIKTIDD